MFILDAVEDAVHGANPLKGNGAYDTVYRSNHGGLGPDGYYRFFGEKQVTGRLAGNL
ncbi:hypothetical protein KIP69_13110 [Geobacter sulfurreducens]|jgi:hypothetical protein|uniref:Uncharacterized protein n=1 Tax=Geobacter anodireducens TaxID=1340425 RepID=A0ABR9NUX2_9BACT|nr:MULTISPECIES: hypothetical protein [Geobacter]MBE2888051.1 hypothetical protein [Geobacter anodireducens]QVW34525.1 hypothetical protein KIP69_13110 [Geobacter sulfurreducens]UTG92028.1 hypothetical protein J8622_13450 [Geobacter sulfurreducens]